MTDLSRPTIGRARRLFFVVLVLDVLVDLVVAVTATLAFIDRGILAAGIFAAIALAIIAEGVLEFPTGVLADRFGRGRSVALSFVARGIANVVLLATDTLYGLLAAQLLLAFGVTLASGALVSWGVDVAYKGEEDLDPLFKRVGAASLAAVAAGYGVGGLLGDADLTIPFGVAGLLCLIGAAVAWRPMARLEALRPGSTAAADERLKTGAILAHTRATLRSDRGVAAMVVATGVLGAAMVVPGVQWSVKLVEDGMSTGGAGLLRSIAALVGAAVLVWLGRASGNEKLRARLDIGAGLLCGLAVAAAGISEGWTSRTFYFAYVVFAGLLNARLAAELNQRLGETSRASVLSGVAALEAVIAACFLAILALTGVAVGETTVSWVLVGVLFATISLFGWRVVSRPPRAPTPPEGASV